VGIDGCTDLLHKEVWPGQHNYLVLHDFTQGPLLRLTINPDVIWSCEFVEHVESRYENNFLSLFGQSRIVMLTHAIPGQSGYHHVNCQPAEYWISRLACRGLSFDQRLTEESRRGSTGFWRKTGMVFVRQNHLMEDTL
jgi:hypothetical protein